MIGFWDRRRTGVALPVNMGHFSLRLLGDQAEYISAEIFSISKVFVAFSFRVH